MTAESQTGGLAATGQGDRIPPEVLRLGLVVIIGVVMSFLDSTIVNVGLHSVSDGLGMSLSLGQWTVTAYLLALSGALPATTWAVGRLGPRRLYTTSLLVFTAASALCGLARSPAELITFRALQGIGGGMLLPASQMVLVPASGRWLPRVMGMLGVPVTFAPMIGPTVGGLILQYAGWRWIFLINLPIGVVGLFLAYRTLHRHRPAGEPATAPRSLDVLGLLLISPGMALVTYGLTEAGNSGRLGAVSVLPFLGGLLFILVFALRSWRIRNPLLDLRIYRRSAVLGAASFTSLAMGAVLFGSTLLMPLYYELVRDRGSMATGLLMVPHGIGVAITTWLSGRVFDRLGDATVLVGAIVTLAAAVPFAFVGAATPYWALVAVTLIRGAGIGLANMPAMTVAFRAAGGAATADVSAQLNMLQRFGGSLGIAAFVMIVHRGLASAGADPGERAGAFAAAHGAVLVAVVAAALSALIIAILRRRARNRGPET